MNFEEQTILLLLLNTKFTESVITNYTNAHYDYTYISSTNLIALSCFLDSIWHIEILYKLPTCAKFKNSAQTSFFWRNVSSLQKFSINQVTKKWINKKIHVLIVILKGRHLGPLMIEYTTVIDYLYHQFCTLNTIFDSLHSLIIAGQQNRFNWNKWVRIDLIIYL